MRQVLVVAPHPDDETLGCGGTILKARANGIKVDWLIMTEMPADAAWADERRVAREYELGTVAQAFGFSGVHRTGFPASRLDDYAKGEVIDAARKVVHTVQPDVVYLPFPGDAHSDHAVTYDALSACIKSFRAPFVRQVICYETLSETNFGLSPLTQGFRPNMFCDISQFLETKIANMAIYEGEMNAHPFPRSEAAIRALATLRGSEAGVAAAEAFQLIKCVV
jgi:LmbE family N-acetylglucosaminyl deacetylase